MSCCSCYSGCTMCSCWGLSVLSAVALPVPVACPRFLGSQAKQRLPLQPAPWYFLLALE